MKHPRRPSRQSSRAASRATQARAGARRRYVKPKVEAAGTVFGRTRALAGAGKDALSGSGIL